MVTAARGPASGRIRTVVVGGGRIGELHARNLVSRVPQLQLVAVIEPAPSDSLTELCREAGIPVGAALDEYLPDVEAVIVAVPTRLHEEVATAAASAGAHVFCEKPLAEDLAAAGRIVAAAERAATVLQVGFNRRFDHNYRALRSAVETGALGRVEVVRITSRDPGPPGIDYILSSGGLFMDMSIHDFDMARFLTGDEVESVFARGACLIDDGIKAAGDIDTAITTLRFRSGSLGIVENSRRTSYGYDQRAEIHGSNGTAESGNDTPSRVRISDAAGVHTEKPLSFFLDRYDESFVAEMQSFAGAIRNGRSPEVTGHDGIEAMRIAVACRRSLDDSCEVMLADVERDG